MGLLNDIRFYLMAALAVLFLLMVAMCSSAYDSSTDGHANSGVNNSHDTTMSAEDGVKAEVEEVAAEVETAKTEEAVAETAAVVSEETEVPKDEAATAVQAVAKVEETATAATEAATETATEAATDTATTAQSTVSSTVDGFELTPLTDTGDAVPDFNNNIGSLKGDLGRYGDRLQEAQDALEKLKEATN